MSENEQLRERIAELEEENEQLRERVAEQDERIRELEEELAEARETTARERALDRQRLDEVENAVEAVDSVASEESVADLEAKDLTPMEQIARLPDHVAVDQFDNDQHRNTFRARSIVRDWSNYRTKAPRGELIWNRDLCRVLAAQEEKRVESKTGMRVMDRIEELSKGAWAHDVHNGEHVLVLEEPEKLGRPGDTAVS